MSPKPRTRTIDATDHQPRFRPETVEPHERPRLQASIGDFCIAKQMARLEANDSDQR